ncbi:Mur ligase family protein [Phycisphaeraceae bacterium D3-23]
MPESFEDQRVTVMGLGRFGGGVGVTRFLCHRGAQVLVTDQSPPEKLAESVAKLQPLIDSGQVTLRLGEHNVSDFTTCDLVVVNPAVPPGNRFLRAAEAAGIPITTEIRLLVERLPNRLRTIGVTGSAGKSTVTAMIGHVLEKVFSGKGGGDFGGEPTPSRQDAKTPREASEKKRVWVGGNIGGSLLEQVDAIGPEDWVVLELSSFMLERLRDQPDAPGYAEGKFRGWSPHIAVVTNISENHLDWHGSMAEYANAKRIIFAYQESGDEAIVGEHVAEHIVEFNDIFDLLDSWVHVANASIVYLVDPDGMDTDFYIQCSLPGTHNLLNAKFAASVCVSALIRPNEAGEYVDSELNDEVDKQIHEVLADFPGLPHRLQFVGTFDGVKYYNDSKCTTPGAARLAVEAFRDGAAPKTVSDTVSEKTVSDTVFGVHLIVGGYDKGSDLAPLAGFARSACKAIYTIGDTGEGVALAAEAASRRGGSGGSGGGGSGGRGGGSAVWDAGARGRGDPGAGGGGRCRAAFAGVCIVGPV